MRLHLTLIILWQMKKICYWLCLHDDDISLLATDQADWLPLVTCHRCGRKCHFEQNYPVPNDVTAQQKKLTAANDGRNNEKKFNGMSTTVIQTITTATPVSLDIISVILKDVAKVGHANRTSSNTI